MLKPFAFALKEMCLASPVLGPVDIEGQMHGVHPVAVVLIRSEYEEGARGLPVQRVVLVLIQQI